MTNYTLEQILDKNIVILNSEYGSQMWSRITLRKDTICEETKLALSKGMKAFRPNTNGYNRMHRISEIGMNGICALGPH